MTDLLTKNERETVERARRMLSGFTLGWEPSKDIADLLAIIDNLTKCNPPQSAELGVMMRGVKKYSEEELKEKC